MFEPLFRPVGPITRASIETQIELLVELLDVLDGDPDREDGDEDCCPAMDDTGGAESGSGGARMWEFGPGDPADAEDDDEDCCLALDGAPPVFALDPGLAYRTIAGGC